MKPKSIPPAPENRDITRIAPPIWRSGRRKRIVVLAPAQIARGQHYRLADTLNSKIPRIRTQLGMSGLLRTPGRSNVDDCAGGVWRKPRLGRCRELGWSVKADSVLSADVL